MTYDEFQAKLEARFTYTKIIVRNDVHDGLRRFEETDLAALWDEVHSNYDKPTPPTWAAISKIAKEAGIGRTSPSKGSVKHWVFRCETCGTYFGGHSRPENGQKCTACMKSLPAQLITLGKDVDPFSLNQKEFSNKAGNPEKLGPKEPHTLSLDYPKWLKAQNGGNVVSNTAEISSQPAETGLGSTEPAKVVHGYCQASEIASKAVLESFPDDLF
jgi:hypothetical protein